MALEDVRVLEGAVEGDLLDDHESLGAGFEGVFPDIRLLPDDVLDAVCQDLDGQLLREAGIRRLQVALVHHAETALSQYAVFEDSLHGCMELIVSCVRTRICNVQLLPKLPVFSDVVEAVPADVALEDLLSHVLESVKSGQDCSGPCLRMEKISVPYLNHTKGLGYKCMVRARIRMKTSREIRRICKSLMRPRRRQIQLLSTVHTT